MGQASLVVPDPEADAVKGSPQAEKSQSLRNRTTFL